MWAASETLCENLLIFLLFYGHFAVDVVYFGEFSPLKKQKSNHRLNKEIKYKAFFAKFLRFAF